MCYNEIMSKGAVNFSTDNEYYTPKEFVEMFGQFDYDPATTDEKAREFNIIHYDTIETNGLTKNWNYRNIWINPPFTIKHLFLEKSVQSYNKYLNNIYILIPIEFLTTKRFHKIMKDINFTLYLPNGRIKFESGLNKKSTSPAFGCVVIKIGGSKNEIKQINVL